LEFGVFPALFHDAQKSSLKEKEKDASILLAEDGAEKTASCNERQSDGCRNKEDNNEGHRGSGSQYQVELGRPCSRKGATQTGASNINVGCKIRQKEDRATEDTKKTVAGGEWSQVANTRNTQRW